MASKAAKGPEADAMTDHINEPQDAELRPADEATETTPTQATSDPERGGLGLAALLWLLGVPGLIILLVLLL
jgi:hypothetical protein